VRAVTGTELQIHHRRASPPAINSPIWTHWRTRKRQYDRLQGHGIPPSAPRGKGAAKVCGEV